MKTGLCLLDMNGLFHIIAPRVFALGPAPSPRLALEMPYEREQEMPQVRQMLQVFLL